MKLNKEPFLTDRLMKYVIFDLDLTLVDTSCLESYRHQRDWQGAYSNIHRCSLYPGIQDVFDYIIANNITVSIVSTSPRSYVERIVRYFKIPANYIVAYHDAKPIKPAPAPMIKAMELMGCSAVSVVAFGDRAIDIKSSKGASIRSIACTWGTKEIALLLQSGPDAVIDMPTKMIEFIR